ncbi:pentatricopeptide repeat-containing protein 2, mitochondrial-like [Microplitis mediator]|uniref:pentatricopeptide repeat-containing protein 2, mitochondrial-like n=1 Tax=Microplitis mediator TaxID=375433 RepID=UPI0025555C74|nr:pentatricopeptide repeat-containing protein 2, mitochondrial-like [Microplitis mediator]
MASTFRQISKLNFGILNKVIKQQLIYNGNRTLYDESSLGLDNYKSIRNIVTEKYKVGIDAFKAKMHESVADEKAMIFTEDLKAVLHLTEKKPEDIELLVKMLEKYNCQNAEMRFGTFKFGPIVMRALHYMNEPDIALDLFMNTKYDEFFNQLSSFLVLLDLLYENKKYKEVLNAYDKIKLKFVSGISHPKLVINLVAVSCYKENTKESLEYGLKICKDLHDRGSIPLRKCIAALGGLALNLKMPHVTLELCSLSKTSDYISVRCLRIMALADLDRIDDIVIEIKAILKRGPPEKNQFYSDVITRIEEAIKRLNIGEDEEICQLLKVLQSQGYVLSMTFDEHISLTMKTITKENQPMTGRYQSSSWSDAPRNNNYERHNNPNYYSHGRMAE